MIETLATIFTGGTAAVAGGLFGTVGALVGKWLEARHQREMLRLQIEQRRAERDHELAVMDREAAHAEKLAVVQAERDVQVADLEALSASVAAEARGAAWSAPWAGRLSGGWAQLAGLLLVAVDVVRGLTRPVITYYLVGLVTALTLRAFADAGGLERAQAYHLIAASVDMTLFLACTAVGWWFGSRPAGGRIEKRA